MIPKKEIYQVTQISVSDFYLLDDPIRQKMIYYVENTNRTVPIWDNLTAMDEALLSGTYVTLCAFDMDEVKATNRWNEAIKRGEQANLDFVGKHLFSRIKDTSRPIAPEGWDEKEYSETIMKRGREKYDEVFHNHFTRHIEDYLDKIGVF